MSDFPSFIVHRSSFIVPTRPIALIQIDLDGLWAVRRCYGGEGAPEQDDPVYSRALPALLDLLDRFEAKATFFVVGADAQVAWKRRLLESAVERGHELANHSMTHDLALGQRERDRLEEEVGGCQRVLKEAFGIEARGFRAPGYGLTGSVLETLRRLGLRYDSSLLPTPWGWAMRGIARWISGRRRGKSISYGSWMGWRAPLRPCVVEPADRSDPSRTSEAGSASKESLWELPVSVTPRLRLPFHGGVGFLLGRRWVERAIGSLSRREGFLNYVIHGMDLVDGREWEATPTRRGRRFFAGRVRERLEFFEGVCRAIRERFEIRRTDRWVEEAQTRVEND